MAVKVMMGSPYPYDESKIKGGIEAVAVNLVHAIAERDDIELHVASFNTSVKKRYSEKRYNVLFHWFPTFQLGWGLRTITMDNWRFRRLCKLLRPDIIHAQGTSAYSFSHISGIPMVLTIHGLELFEPVMQKTKHFSGLTGIYRKWVGNKIVNQSIRNSNAIISIAGDYTKRVMGNLLNGIIVHSIPNPISNIWFEEYHNSNNDKKILCVGDIIERKNALGLVNAFSDVLKVVPAAKLLFAGGIGEPSYYNSVLEIIRLKNLIEKVVFLGRLNEEQLINIYRESSIVALISIQETLPMSLLQAMAMSKPVVATNVGGVSSMIINNQNGILIESFDSKSITDNIILLLNDSDLCRRLGKEAHQYSKSNYRADIVAEKTIQIYKSLLISK